MAELSDSVVHMIEQLARLPGIGRKSAERLAYHLLAESEMCNLCRDPSRDQNTVCVVQQPRDLMAIEQSGTYRGLYHVLLGRIAPLENIGPDQLTIDGLIERVASGNFSEVIMATNPTVEGDGTALYISNVLNQYDVPLTRLARGITTGSILEYTNKEILADAISGRQPLAVRKSET